MASQAALKLVGKEEGDKQRALEAALAQIDRAFGKGSVMKLGEKGKVEIESISTGSLGLDIALGIGGLPKGRVIEIYGPESSGKTTWPCTWWPSARRPAAPPPSWTPSTPLDPGYAFKLGVNLDDLLVSQPDTGEQALEITDTLVRSGAVDIVVIDSVAALTPKAEIEGEMGDSLPGLQARLMSQALRKLTASINKANTIVIFINQIRHKIGVMYGSAGNDHRRQRAEVLRLGAPGHPPHRLGEGPRRDHRQQRPREGGQEQGGPAVPRGRVRHHVRRGHLQAGRRSSTWASRPGSSTSRAPGSPTAASASARAATMSASS
jgi:RecA/RadA recombinase